MAENSRNLARISRAGQSIPFLFFINLAAMRRKIQQRDFLKFIVHPVWGRVFDHQRTGGSHAMLFVGRRVLHRERVRQRANVNHSSSQQRMQRRIKNVEIARHGKFAKTLNWIWRPMIFRANASKNLGSSKFWLLRCARKLPKPKSHSMVSNMRHW